MRWFLFFSFLFFAKLKAKFFFVQRISEATSSHWEPVKKTMVEKKAFIDLRACNDWLIMFNPRTDQYLMSQRSHLPEDKKTKNKIVSL